MQILSALSNRNGIGTNVCSLKGMIKSGSGKLDVSGAYADRAAISKTSLKTFGAKSDIIEAMNSSAAQTGCPIGKV